MNTNVNAIINGNIVKVGNHYAGYDKRKGKWSVFTKEHQYVQSYPTLEQAVIWMQSKQEEKL